MPLVNPAHLVQAINLYPGSGEYVYEISQIVSDGDILNIHNDQRKTDALLSLEHLKQTIPNLKYISVMINWFATSLNAGEARVIPKVESNDKASIWQVANYTRKTAEEVHHFDNGEMTFGGTPTDRSIVELCSFLKNNGYKIMLSPILMVDDESLTKPWRGHITTMGKNSARQKDIEHFFKNQEGYNKFILHYANLEYNNIKLKDIIDSFIIGSELRSLTSIKVNEYLYPAIQQLKELASLVKLSVGKNVKLTYSANWGDEYHNFNLDQLWCDPNIDWVGISAYFPLTDNLSQDQITYNIIKNGWSSGEGIDYYKNEEGPQPYNDQAWAWKNVEYWWNSFHSTGQTCWTPKMKPIIFTEYGFSSVDGTTNNPSLYYEPEFGTTPNANNNAQSLAITASEIFFMESNAKNENLLPWRFLYVWDVRPYPYFPNNCHFWSDCNSYKYSHAVNGKIGSTLIDIPNSDLNMIGSTYEHNDL